MNSIDANEITAFSELFKNYYVLQYIYLNKFLQIFGNLKLLVLLS